MQLIMKSLTEVIKNFINLLKTKISVEINESNYLILLTNLKFLQMHMIHDIINSFFGEFEVGIDINPVVVKDIVLKNITAIIDQNVFEIKKIFSEKKIEKIFFWTLENLVNDEILNDRKFVSLIFGNDKNKIEEYQKFRLTFSKEIEALNIYNSLIFSTKELEDKEIRYYILDILNELVVISNEIIENSPFYVDELMKNLIIFVTIAFLKPLKLLNSMNIEKIKQVILFLF